MSNASRQFKFHIRDYDRPDWKSFGYPARENAERDAMIAQAYHHANKGAVPRLYVEEARGD